jgi:tight adherence protein B
LTFFAVLLGGVWVGPAWDATLRRYVGDSIRRLQSLGVSSEHIDRYMRWWGMAMIGTVLVFGIVLRMIPVAVGLTYLVFIAPPHLIGWRIEKRRILLRDQMVRAATTLANSARAGLSQIQGIELLCRESPEPLAAEFRRIVHDYHAGRPLAGALEEAQKRLDIDAFTVFVTVLLVCMERGGNLSHALDRISTDLLESQRLARKVEADTAAGRRTALLLSVFPLLFLVGFTLMDPRMMSYVYTTQAGQLTLLGVGVLIYVAVKWCLRIMRIDF